MGLTTPTLTWQDTPRVEDEDVHDQAWPLLDDLIVKDNEAVMDPGHKARKAALSALIRAAFEPRP